MAKFRNIKKFPVAGADFAKISAAKVLEDEKEQKAPKTVPKRANISKTPSAGAKLEKPPIPPLKIEPPAPRKRGSSRPKKVGAFVVILTFTIVMQFLLLISLLYLSPDLLR